MTSRRYAPELRSIPLTEYDCLSRYSLIDFTRTKEIFYCSNKMPTLNCKELRELGLCHRGFP